MTPEVRFASDRPISPSIYLVASTSKPPRYLPTTYPTRSFYTPIRVLFSPLEQISSAPPGKSKTHQKITLLDHQISKHGGTASAIARLPNRIQRNKIRISDKERIEELTQDLNAQVEENDHLKRVNYELNGFRQKVMLIFQDLQNAL